jgi:hypothetical protein
MSGHDSTSELGILGSSLHIQYRQYCLTNKSGSSEHIAHNTTNQRNTSVLVMSLKHAWLKFKTAMFKTAMTATAIIFLVHLFLPIFSSTFWL